jgi:hypothetical protein
MSRNNFKNPNTGDEFYIAKSTMKVKGNEIIYTDNVGNELKDEDGTILVPIKREGKIGVPNVGLWQSRTLEDRQSIMRKRSADHNKRTGFKDEWIQKSKKA